MYDVFICLCIISINLLFLDHKNSEILLFYLYQLKLDFIGSLILSNYVFIFKTKNYRLHT